MSITDELREYIWQHATNNDELRAIADRIDAEHERACKEQYACGVEHGIGASIEASMIQEHGFIELPKDADGEYIHIGDMMHGTCPSGKYVCGEVSAIGANKFWLRNVPFSLRPDYMRHYHEPTVEDVLSEMLEQAFPSDFMHRSEAIEAMVAEYAAKLRLAEGEDE